MLTKPCARPGCQELVKETHGPVLFAYRKYCSRRCSMLARRVEGRAHVFTYAQCIAAGKIGGTVAGRNRRDRALKAAVASVVSLIPPALAEEWTATQHALLLVLMGRAMRRGYRLGTKAAAATRRSKRVARQAEKQRKQAA